MSSLKIILLLSISVIGLLAVHTSSAFAIDFADRTGYTPSWAQSMNNYQALDRCNGIVGENSADGNWCMEWVSSVLDNKDSTNTTHPTTSMSERDCTVGNICIFPGEFLKYRGTSSNDQNSACVRTTYFGPIIEENKIRIHNEFCDAKPFYGVLDLHTGILTLDDNTTGTSPIQILRSIPVQKSIESDIWRCSQCKITYDTESFMNQTKEVLVARQDAGNNGFDEYHYDNVTGVMLSTIEVSGTSNSHRDEGNLVDTNIFDHPTKIVSTYEQTNRITENQNSPTQDIQSKSEPSQNETFKDNPIASNTSNESNIGYIIVGILVVIVLPAIVIIVVIWKIRQVLVKRRNNKLQKGI